MKLQEQPFQVLVELLPSAGRVATRAQLQQKLWPVDTFVDFDVGLNTAIRKIRQALATTPTVRTLIETSAKRGYKFLAPVNITTNPQAFLTENVTPSQPCDDQKFLICHTLRAVVCSAIARERPSGDGTAPTI